MKSNLFEITVFTQPNDQHRGASAAYTLYDADSVHVMTLARSLETASGVTLIRVYLNNVKIHEWGKDGVL